MKIQVTQEDIDKGVPHQPYLCPIALAAQRELKTDVGIGTGSATIFTPDGDDYTDCSLPSEAVAFIDMFDSGFKVEPFEFTLRYQENR